MFGKSLFSIVIKEITTFSYPTDQLWALCDFFWCVKLLPNAQNCPTSTIDVYYYNADRVFYKIYNLQFVNK